ncbi:hypothetical protein DSM110093_00242 [Sulfitobacter sp. DSM 110093]|nr:hypothetical protein DSM110093_00242 [Sulfitobacter sp. DSM 110093]
MKISGREKPVRTCQIKRENNPRAAWAAHAGTDRAGRVFAQDQDALGVGTGIVHAPNDR